MLTLTKYLPRFCLYFLFILVWSYVYLVIEIWKPGSFNIETWQVLTEDTRRRLYNELYYFSGVTITTLGFGDISPVTKIARSWVTLQAIIGQFYLAIVIARLVGLYTSERLVKKNNETESKKGITP